MEDVIAYIKKEHPSSEVFPSADKDFVCVRGVIGQSNFGKNEAGETVAVSMTDTKKFHVDTIRMRMPLGMNALKDQIDRLTDDERMELFGNYCRHCGCDNPYCQCWNDD